MVGFLDIEFVRNAFIVGTMIAIVSAFIGYFVIIRGLSFAVHALAHMGFAGAAGAVFLGMDPVYGLLVCTLLAGGVMGVLGNKVRERDVSIGIVLAFALGTGALFLSFDTKYASEVFTILFGTIVGVGIDEMAKTLFLSVVCIIIVFLIFRPLLFSSVTIDVARGRGVPVKALSVIFMLVLATTISISVQIVGVLLIFTLIVVPSATAKYLASTPRCVIILSILIGVFEVWIGIMLSFYISWPVSFFIATVGAILYLSARVYARFE